MGERELLRRTAEIASDFLESLDERPVWPPASVEELRRDLGGPLPNEPVDPLTVIEELAAAADRGVVAMPGGRYFGFVIGGSLPAALAADWLDEHLGSERRSRRRRARGGGCRGSGRRVAQGALRPAGTDLVRVRHRVSDGARHVPRRGASRRARTRGLGRRAQGPRRRASCAGLRRGQTPRHRQPGATPPRLRQRGAGGGLGRRSGPNAA